VPQKATRDVIVLLPGIAGSVLQKNGQDVRAVSDGSAVAALAFRQQIANAFRRHDGYDDYRRNGYAIRLVVGTFQPTARSAHLDDVKVMDGDETEFRASAKACSRYPHSLCQTRADRDPGALHRRDDRPDEFRR
jgi:hypothetical protein